MLARAMFYYSVVQGVLIYWSEIWIITDSMIKVLEGFHHYISQKIVGKMVRCIGVEGWEWPPMEEALEAVVLWYLQ